MRRAWIVAVFSVVLGCGDESEEIVGGPGTRAPENPAPTKVEPPTPPAAAGPVITDPSFELRANASGPYTSGALGQFGIVLTPRGNYHVNEEFPITVTVSGPAGVAFPKSTLERGDAAEFGEQRARFDVPFTPSAPGEHRVEAKVSFAVCTPENCIPDERTLAVLLPVR